MSKQVEQIRAEVERRIKSWAAGVKYEGDAGDCQSRVTELTDLKKFIDSLPKEDGPKKRIEDQCNRCLHRRKKDGFCCFPYGGLTYCVGENGVYDCSGFEPVETESPAENTEADLEAEIDSYWKKVTGYLPPFAVLKLKMKDVAKIARHFAEWERKRTLDKVVEWMKANLTYTHPRKGVETCMVNIPAFLDAMNEENT